MITGNRKRFGVPRLLHVLREFVLLCVSRGGTSESLWALCWQIFEGAAETRTRHAGPPLDHQNRNPQVHSQGNRVAYGS